MKEVDQSGRPLCMQLEDGPTVSLEAVPVIDAGASRLAAFVQIRWGDQGLSVDEIRKMGILTRREAQVAALLARRRSNKQISQVLSISPHTA